MRDWQTAIVQVWQGNPLERGKLLGTAFRIAPGYLPPGYPPTAFRATVQCS